MLTFAVGILLAVSAAYSREAQKPIPSITNSLVNLGKMEVSIHFNGVSPDAAFDTHDHLPQSPSSHSLKPERLEELVCPCSGLRNLKDTFFSNPGGLFNKIVMNNDIFSPNKDPFSSALCCESHEQHGQEGMVIFEFPPNGKGTKNLSFRSNGLPGPLTLKPLSKKALPMPMPYMPFIFDSIMQKKAGLPQLKTKSIEIFLFPKKNEAGGVDLRHKIRKTVTEKGPTAPNKELFNKNDYFNKNLFSDDLLSKEVLSKDSATTDLPIKFEQGKDFMSKDYIGTDLNKDDHDGKDVTTNVVVTKDDHTDATSKSSQVIVQKFKNEINEIFTPPSVPVVKKDLNVQEKQKKEVEKEKKEDHIILMEPSNKPNAV